MIRRHDVTENALRCSRALDLEIRGIGRVHISPSSLIADAIAELQWNQEISENGKV